MERESLFEWVTRVLRDPDPSAELARLGARARSALAENLAPEESIRVVVRGAGGQAIVGADTRAIVLGPCAEVTSRPYVDVLGLEVNERIVGGSIVLRALDGEDTIRAAGDWDVIRARIATLRGLIAGARSDSVRADLRLIAS